jgi:predicted GIY-YIG superfamily endonuclease
LPRCRFPARAAKIPPAKPEKPLAGIRYRHRLLSLQIAGWSSLVARQAHNLKAAGSNPAPATTLQPIDYRVYVLRNCEARFYIGISQDVAHRLDQHNAGVSRWTRSKGPWSLAGTSQPMSLTDARKLENKLKRQKGGSGFSGLTGLSRSSGS